MANAADASHLYAAHSQRDVPAVSIRLYQHGGSDWLEVEDHGIGMTQHQMAESLLDFGRSQWKATTNSDLADLPAASFRPRGKFGIGFFSAFMIADRVEIKSLRYRQGSSETAMLVFEDGLAGRPLFRNVPVREELTQNGTLVRLRLKNPPLSEKGLLETDAIEQSVSQMVRDMLINMCALLDVDLKFEGPDDRDAKRLIEANEWSTLPADQLFDRIYTFDMKNPNYQKMYIEWRKYFIENEQSLFDEDGRVIGRAVLASGLENESTADVWWWPAPDAKTYVGGLLSDYVYNCLGAFSGAPLKADRNSSFPLANPSELQRWASTQIDLMDRKRFASSSTRYGAADLGRSVGVSLPSMPCGILRSGEISPDQLGDWLSTRNEVVIIPDWEINTYHSDSGSLVFRERQQGRQLDLPDNAIVIRLGSRNFFPEEIQKTAKDSRFGDFGDLRLREWNPRNWWYQYGKSGSTALLLEHVLQQWGVTPHQVAEHFEQLALVSDKDTRAPIKLFESDQTVLIEGFRLRRPTEQSE
ncbi:MULTISPECIES: ATP-binding protein [unclassified Rathayibacter]|uniref:ATP-binding protein n=1 Tax=unclassified Rathayibacter TaxID=2609250 RepID=UPI001FB3A595|nr:MULTISPECIES: ATP-binding protein [unclassified Rathayibacter]